MSEHEHDNRYEGMPLWAESLEHRLQRKILIAAREILRDLAALRHDLGVHAETASGLRLTVGGSGMADTVLDVDVTGERAVAQWLDDKGDVTAVPPNGPDGAPASFRFASTDETVATVDPSTGELTFLKAGNATITVDAVDATGQPLPGFPTQAANLVLTPGVATSLEISVEGAAPVPAPELVPPADVPAEPVAVAPDAPAADVPASDPGAATDAAPVEDLGSAPPQA